MGWLTRILPFLLCATSFAGVATFHQDVAFPQPISIRYETEDKLKGAIFKRLEVNYEGVPYVLSDRGVARLFDYRIALDQSFRPLTAKLARDISTHYGRLFYLFDDAWLSNARAGAPHGRLPAGYRHFAVADNGAVLLSGTNNLALYSDGLLTALPFAAPGRIGRIYARTNTFYTLTSNEVHQVYATSVEPVHRGPYLTTLAFRGNEMLVGTTNGFYGVNLSTGRLTFPLQTGLPSTQITRIVPATNGLWVGTTRGLFLQTGPSAFQYFASKRWLPDDHVVDLFVRGGQDVLVLTRLGLSRIEYQPMTLADKAAYYDRKIRERHVRYGFCSELHLNTPGDISTGETIDSDQDGIRSSLYMASQAFRFAVTGDEKARANAWETFDAIERLQWINRLDGFPALTFERAGFRSTHPDRWHSAPDAAWEWMAHTGSDEIAAQTFGYAVMYEVAARTPGERTRIAAAYDRLLSHVVRNDYQLIGLDGQPTSDGRWNPAYVNKFPPTLGQRRLISSEIIAFLQFAHHITGKLVYRDKGQELLTQQGYLRNITNTLANIRPTPGFVRRGVAIGHQWDHSDDLIAFLNYWTLYRFAFDEDLRKAYAEAVRDHWTVESAERNPLWSFIGGMTGAPTFDLEGGIWTMKRFPLSLISWRVVNSHRADVEKAALNFRRHESVQLLPADERPAMRWSQNPYVIDGGDGGFTELAGEQFLLPYWMGRYLRFIQ